MAFLKYLKYKTKYLNLLEQKGGGEFKNFKFNIEENKSHKTGYDQLKEIIKSSDKDILNTVDYVHEGTTHNLNINAKLSKSNKENLPPKISNKKIIYFLQ
jgi:hypothetical protein